MNSKLMNACCRTVLQFTFPLCQAIFSLTPKCCALFPGTDNSPGLVGPTVHPDCKLWQREVANTWDPTQWLTQ